MSSEADGTKLNDGIGYVLLRLAELLRAADEPEKSHTFETLAVNLRSAPIGSAERSHELLVIRSLYSMGMGGLMDVVLQDERGVLPSHDEFSRLRHELFELVTAELKKAH